MAAKPAAMASGGIGAGLRVHGLELVTFTSFGREPLNGFAGQIRLAGDVDRCIEPS